jgi:hypothetical protein
MTAGVLDFCGHIVLAAPAPCLLTVDPMRDQKLAFHNQQNVNCLGLRVVSYFAVAILCDFAPLRETASFGRDVGSRKAAKPAKDRKVRHYRFET